MGKGRLGWVRSAKQKIPKYILPAEKSSEPKVFRIIFLNQLGSIRHLIFNIDKLYFYFFCSLVALFFSSDRFFSDCSSASASLGLNSTNRDSSFFGRFRLSRRWRFQNFNLFQKLANLAFLKISQFSGRPLPTYLRMSSAESTTSN